MQYGMRGEWMEMIYEWIRSIVFYLILMTMILNLLPDKKYEKYLRLFTGLVFLTLVLAPFSGLGGAGEQVVEAFSRITFQNDAKMLRREIEDADGARMKQLVEQYRAMMEEQVRNDIEIQGVSCVEVEITLDESVEHETFGCVRFVSIILNGKEERPQSAMLKQMIGERYGVEEGNVEIHFTDE